MAVNNLDKIIKTVEHIPTLPIVSKQIMLLLGDENVSLKQVAELIERDQALTVRILKIANSAFYGTLSKVSNIDHAMVILGIQEIRSILFAFSVHGFFSRDKTDGFDRTRFWRHSVVCSQVAKYLARYFNVANDETLFLSALIHDIGKVVLDQYFHEEFLQILDYVSSKEESFSKAEKEVVGITHYQLAAKLLQQWKFPEKVYMQVFYHHAPWHDKNYMTGSIIVYLANIFTKLAGYSCLPTEKKADLAEFARSKVMEYIVKSGFDLDLETMEKLVHSIQEIASSEGRNVLSFLEK